MKSLVNYILESANTSFEFRGTKFPLFKNGEKYPENDSNSDKEKMHNFLMSKLSSNAQKFWKNKGDEFVEYWINSGNTLIKYYKNLGFKTKEEAEKHKNEISPIISIEIKDLAKKHSQFCKIVSNKRFKEAYDISQEYIADTSEGIILPYYVYNPRSRMIIMKLPIYDVNSWVEIMEYIANNYEKVIDVDDIPNKRERERIWQSQLDKEKETKPKTSSKPKTRIKRVQGITTAIKDFFKNIDSHISSIASDYGYKRNEENINKFKEYINKNYSSTKDFKIISEHYEGDWTDKLEEDGTVIYEFIDMFDGNDEPWLGVVEYKGKTYIESWIDLDYPIVYEIKL